jgi:hypothetical protein
MEHRWGQRVKVDIPVWVQVAGGTAVPGRIFDLSISGAFIRAPCCSSELAPLQILLCEHAIDAHVVRIESMHLAVEWSQLGPEAVITLLRLATGGAHSPSRLTRPPGFVGWQLAAHSHSQTPAPLPA